MTQTLSRLPVKTFREIRDLQGTETAPTPEIQTVGDLELLRRYGQGNDSQAFAEIVRRHASFVYSTCLRVLGNPARAEDASQETFFRLMQRPHEINQSLGAWLHRTATHLAVDALRSDSSRRRREISYSETRDREASSWSELSPAVDQALSELPNELRVLMVHHFLLGKAQSELAAETGQSPATISRRIHQGLDELRQRLRLKGVYAVPAALAGLLLHASARQAPASLVCELGKMAMYSSAAKPTHLPRVDSHGVSSMQSKIIITIISAISAVMVLQMVLGNWPHTLFGSRPAQEIERIR